MKVETLSKGKLLFSKIENIRYHLNVLDADFERMFDMRYGISDDISVKVRQIMKEDLQETLKELEIELERL